MGNLCRKFNSYTSRDDSIGTPSLNDKKKLHSYLARIPWNLKILSKFRLRSKILNILGMSLSLGQRKKLWASAVWDRKQPVFLEQPITNMPRSESINSRGAAASTATLYPDFRVKKKSYFIPPPTWFGPSPTQILTLIQFSSAPLSASNWGKQSQGKSCLCSALACAARAGWCWDVTARSSLPTTSTAHRHILPHLCYRTVSDCIFPAATWCTFCIGQQCFNIAQDQLFNSWLCSDYNIKVYYHYLKFTVT